MNKSLWLTSLLLISISVLLLFACAPRAAPTPPPALPAPPTAAERAALSPEEAAWAKMVEAAKKEGRLLLYTFGFTGDAGRAVARAFGEKYGIRLEFVTGVGVVLIERIKTEQAAGKYIADTLDTSPGLLPLAQQAGALQPWGDLPQLKEREALLLNPMLDKEGYILAYGPMFQLPYVNTALVKSGEEPRSYRELLEPRWKRKMSAVDPKGAVALARLYAVMVPERILDDDFFRRLGQQELRLAPNVREDAALVVRGEVSLTVAHFTNLMAPFIREGAPIKPLPMKEGAILTPNPAITLVNNAPHPNAARLFANWLVSAEGQRTYFQAIGGMPLRKDVPDFTAPAGRFNLDKVLVSTIAHERESSRLQREKVMEKLLGLEK